MGNDVVLSLCNRRPNGLEMCRTNSKGVLAAGCQLTRLPSAIAINSLFTDEFIKRWNEPFELMEDQADDWELGPNFLDSRQKVCTNLITDRWQASLMLKPTTAKPNSLPPFLSTIRVKFADKRHWPFGRNRTRKLSHQPLILPSDDTTVFSLLVNENDNPIWNK